MTCHITSGIICIWSSVVRRNEKWKAYSHTAPLHYRQTRKAGIIMYEVRTDRGITYYTCKKCGRERGLHKKIKKYLVEGYLCEDCKSNEKYLKRKRKENQPKIDLDEKQSELYGDLYEQAIKEARFERAVSRIEKQVNSINAYKNSIDTVHKLLHRPQWFSSTEEVMMAIQLLKDGYKIIHQQKVGRYKIDFVIPDKKIILEVDGSIFHTNKESEAKRDFFIHKSLGFDWKILHVSTDEVNTRLTKIKQVIEETSKLFSQHI